MGDFGIGDRLHRCGVDVDYEWSGILERLSGSAGCADRLRFLVPGHALLPQHPYSIEFDDVHGAANVDGWIDAAGIGPCSRRLDALAAECAGNHRAVLSDFSQFRSCLYRIRMADHE